MSDNYNQHITFYDECTDSFHVVSIAEAWNRFLSFPVVDLLNLLNAVVENMSVRDPTLQTEPVDSLNSDHSAQVRKRNEDYV